MSVIAGYLGIWLHSFLSNCYHFVRLPGGSSTASPVISGVPQGTVLDPPVISLALSRLDHGSQLLSPTIIQQIIMMEKMIQRK